jgi:hypothetical protein
MKLLNGVQKKTANAFAGDSLEDLVQGVLLGLEGVLPDCRSTRAVDDFENPCRFMLSANRLRAQKNGPGVGIC